jgi:hypothetical protein
MLVLVKQLHTWACVPLAGMMNGKERREELKRD